MRDQDRISAYNINTSSRQMMITKKNINWEIIDPIPNAPN